MRKKSNLPLKNNKWIKNYLKLSLNINSNSNKFKRFSNKNKNKSKTKKINMKKMLKVLKIKLKGWKGKIPNLSFNKKFYKKSYFKWNQDSHDTSLMKYSGRNHNGINKTFSKNFNRCPTKKL